MTVDTVEKKWQSVADGLPIPSGAERVLVDTLRALDRHDKATADHCRRVGVTALRIGEHQGLPLKPLFYAGSLHDYGKLFVDPDRLRKTSEWTDEDAAALRNHPRDGYDALIKEGMVVTAGLVVRHHTFQPNKYPETLPPQPPFMATDFLACARTVALADFYDAAHRPNSAGLATGEEIKAKVLAQNDDLAKLIHELYEAGVFSTDRDH